MIAPFYFGKKLLPFEGAPRLAWLYLWRSRPIVGYPLAAALVALTIVIRLGLDALLSPVLLIGFSPAILASTLLGGLGAGLFAMMLSLAAAWYFFLPPVFSFALNPATVNALAFFLLIGIFNIALIELLMRALERQRDERQRTRIALQAATMGLWKSDVISGQRHWSPETYELFGYRPEEAETVIAQFDELIHEDDRARYKADLAAIFADPKESEYNARYRIVRRDGEIRWVRSRGRIARDAAGRPLHIDGVLMDVTRQYAIEREHELLLQELEHRVKNLMSVIQAIATLTLREGRPVEEVRAVFAKRLEALARANTMQVHRGTGALLDEVIHEELSAFSDQAKVSGCALKLNASGAQSFALIVHELVTNAAKYGALSLPAGIVTIAGKVNGSGKDARLHFEWRERNGPAVQPPDQAGFGRNLLGRVTQGLGVTDWSFAPEGLSFTLDCALSAIAAAETQ